MASAAGKRSRTFIAVFVAAALAQFGLLLAPPVRPFIDGMSGSLASISASLIRAFGGACTQVGAVLTAPGAHHFSMEVRDGCNGVNVVILLWSAMLAWPVRWQWKLAGLGAGFVLLQLLNLLRLISLFYLGQYSPPVFQFAHLYLWELLIIIDAMVIFGLWIRRAARNGWEVA